jgi:hypothetical protein
MERSGRQSEARGGSSERSGKSQLAVEITSARRILGAS